MVQFAGELGVSRERCLADTCVTPAQLDDPAATIRLAQELTIARNVVDELGSLPGLGYRIGQRYRLTAYGAWGWAMLCSQTARESLAFARDYMDLSYALCELTMRDVDGLARIDVAEEWLPERLSVFFREKSVGAVLRMLEDIIPERGWLKEVRLAAQDGPAADWLREAVGVPVRCGKPGTEIVVYGELLDRPLPLANSQARQLSESLCRELLDKRRALLTVTESVRQYLLQWLADSPTPASAAQSLGIGQRTLRRRLAEEGTSFRELHDQVRRSLAVELLGDGVPAARVARRLGYAGPAAFTHAFRRWHGVAPSEFLS